MEKFKIAVIGGGNMGRAFIGGITGRGTDPDGLFLIEIDNHRRKEIEETYKIHTSDKIEESIKDYEVIIIAIKPWNVQDVLLKLSPSLSYSNLVISVAAGITIEFIERHVNDTVPVVRAMPNIAALVGEAAVAISFNKNITERQMQRARTVMESIGKVIEVQEAQINVVTGLSGSGPAFVFLMIEALADGGVLMGLSRDKSIELAVQTVYGSASLLRISGKHPAVLREMVTTPGGTTAEGLLKLEEGRFKSLLINTVKCATEKAKTIGEMLSK